LRRGFVVRKSRDGGELCVALGKRVRLGERESRKVKHREEERDGNAPNRLGQAPVTELEHRGHKENKGEEREKTTQRR
jgi:hypothetical protein